MIANYYLQIKSWIYHRRMNNHSNGQKSNSSIRANSYAESIKFQNYNNLWVNLNLHIIRAGRQQPIAVAVWWLMKTMAKQNQWSGKSNTQLVRVNRLTEKLQHKAWAGSDIREGLSVVYTKKSPCRGRTVRWDALSIIPHVDIFVLRSVPASGGDLWAFVQRSFWVSSQDGQLLGQAQVAALLSTFVRVGFGMDAPCNRVWCIFIFEAPNIRGECSCPSLSRPAESEVVLVEPLFEGRFTQSEVVANWFGWWCDCGLVNDARCQALAIEGAGLTRSAVAGLSAGRRGRGQHFGVVGTDYGSHVLGAAVADFDGVPVENAPVPVTSVEVNVY